MKHSQEEESGVSEFHFAVPMKFLDKRIKFIFGGDRWIQFNFCGRIN